MPERQRNIPSQADVIDIYNTHSETFDQRFNASSKRIKQFSIIDAPQIAITLGVENALEIGCGTGRLLKQLEAKHAIGIDIANNLLDLAKKNGLNVQEADAHNLPFEDASFDAITMGNGVFRYLDYNKALNEMYRVLKPFGRIAIHQYAAYTWSPRQIFKPRDSISMHVQNLGEIRQPATQIGLREEELYLWRTSKFFPYIVRIPEWLALNFWNHATFIFQKDSQRRS